MENFDGASFAAGIGVGAGTLAGLIALVTCVTVCACFGKLFCKFFTGDMASKGGNLSEESLDDDEEAIKQPNGYGAAA